jgi:hypothetical protein
VGTMTQDPLQVAHHGHHRGTQQSGPQRTPTAVTLAGFAFATPRQIGWAMLYTTPKAPVTVSARAWPP